MSPYGWQAPFGELAHGRACPWFPWAQLRCVGVQMRFGWWVGASLALCLGLTSCGESPVPADPDAGTSSAGDLSTSPVPDQSPVDGGRIAFSALPVDPGATGASRIFVVRPDGTELRELNGSTHAWAPRWAPDSQSLLYLRVRTAEDSGASDVWSIAADGGDNRPVVQQPGSVRDLAWSPDGASFVYARADLSAWELVLRRVDTERERILFAGDADADGWWLPEVDWSPTGDRLVVQKREHRGYASLGAIFVTGPGLSGLTRVAYDEISDYRSPRWSPDGRWIAFIGGPEADPGGKPCRSTVYLVHPDGTALHTLDSATAQCVGSLDWSPDSHFLAVARWGASTGSGLWRQPLDGSAPALIRSGPTGDVDWSAN